jgi:4-amino-4-deoxy-L-arabinose transferase-like glycosyltransferase
MNNFSIQAGNRQLTILQKVAGLYPLLLLILAGAVFLAASWGKHELSGADEPRVAGIANEMVISGDWVVPKLNGKTFWENSRHYV